MQLKYRLCRCRCECEMCECKINDLMKEKTGASILFYLPWPLATQPLCSPDPLILLTPIRLSFSLGPFLPPCLPCSPASPKLPAASDLLPLSEIAPDAHPVLSCSHRRTLALGLTERVLIVAFFFNMAGPQAVRANVSRLLLLILWF